MDLTLHIHGLLVAAMVVSAIGVFVPLHAGHFILAGAAGFAWVQIITRR